VCIPILAKERNPTPSNPLYPTVGALKTFDEVLRSNPEKDAVMSAPESLKHGFLLKLVITLLCIAASAGCTAHHVNKMAEDLFSSSKFDEPLPPHPFRSDGCSCWPDHDWVECCVEHDLVYWMGGTAEERRQADLKMKQCVAEKGFPTIAEIMYIGVRLGGVYWLPTPFRWGFGWPYPKSGPPKPR
jgi:hypothetical protein